MAATFPQSGGQRRPERSDGAERACQANDLAELVSETVQLKRVGSSLKGLCPFHDDRHPSLDVDPQRGLWHCFGCGAGGDTVAWVERTRGLSRSEAVSWLFARAGVPDPAREQAERKAPARRREVASYDYVDAEGRLVYQVVRFEPKDFRQRRPDGRGGWAWDLRGIDRVLYRLPEVLAEAGSGGTVWVVEGEKDADALRATGAVATTAAQGAKAPWLDGYTQALQGAEEVVVVADADQPGYARARVVRDALRAGGLAVRVVRAGEGKDAADHLAAGLGLSDFVEVGDEELEELAGPEPEAKPVADLTVPGEGEDGALTREVARLRGLAQPSSWATWLSEPPAPVDWVLPGLAAGETGMLAGAGGQGKTWLALELALGVALGLPWPWPPEWIATMPERVTDGRVAILSGEDGPDQLRRVFWHIGQHFVERAQAEGAASTAETRELIAMALSDNLHVWPTSCDLVERQFGQCGRTISATALIEMLGNIGRHRLIIIDPLAAFAPLAESMPDVAEETNRVLSALAEATGAAILVVHHTSQSARNTGSDDATAARGITSLIDRRRWVGVLGGLTEDEAGRVGEAERGKWARLKLAKHSRISELPPAFFVRDGRFGGLLVPSELPTGAPEPTPAGGEVGSWTGRGRKAKARAAAVRSYVRFEASDEDEE